jgi:hypothetical protein
MANNVPPKDQGVRPYRKTLRLTFRVADGEVQLVRHERLDMICPPSIGERPEAGKHGGFWIELRDAGDRVLFHRVLHSPLGDSVEIHSPDGKIQREFGPSSESIFEVLLPDQDEASTVALMGEYLDATKAGREQAEKAGESARGARELARFKIPEGGESGEVLPGGGK